MPDLRREHEKEESAPPPHTVRTTGRLPRTSFGTCRVPRQQYHGSSEHKSYPSRAGPPALRTDATPCDPDIDWAAISNALAQGVRRGCISEATEQGFPKYVWAWLGGDLYEARHLNGFAGKYKGYRLEPPEYPRDSDRRLDWPAP